MTLTLRAVSLCDFKSFRGKVIISSFNPVTAIIGKNGAGKSNFMDAISFVTGENNVSTLRVKKMCDLICGAHISKPVAKSAYVTLVLTSEDNIDINFTRIITLTATEYRIDDQVVSRHFYLEHLNNAGLCIKAKNFLVFQGASEALAMKTPKEMTQLLEEVSRSVELKEDYENLSRKQQKIEVDIMYMNEKIKLLNAEKKQARVEKEEAQLYKQLEKKYMEAKIELSLLELFHIKGQVNDFRATAMKKELEIQQSEQDKNQANILLKEQERAAGTLFRRMIGIEQEIITAEQAFAPKNSRITVIEEQVSYLQDKLNILRSSTMKEINALKRRKDSIKELETEMERIDRLRETFENSVASQLRSQDSVELEPSQVEDYGRLKQQAYEHAAQFIELLDALRREQLSDQNVFDNENRKKMETEDRLKRVITAKEECVKRLEVLNSNVQEAAAEIVKEEKRRCSAQDQMDKYAQIEQELEKVSHDLGNAYVDMKITSENKKRTEIIQILKVRFPGIYGRLYNICKPTHTRYKIAANAVMGRHLNSIVVSTQKVAKECIIYLRQQRMSVETFLPLDCLKVHPLKERLRSIKEGNNVKLLYDVLTFANEIAPAVLFATKNTLVCDTSEDARLIAYELDNYGRQSCVSLDGTFYRNNGTFSGGKTDLSKKARTWEEKELIELKSRQVDLQMQMREATKPVELKSDVHTSNTRVASLQARIKFIKSDAENSKKHVDDLDNEIRSIREELSIVNAAATSIQARKDSRQVQMRNIESQISAVEDIVFSNFCQRIGVSNIRQFEGRELRDYEKRARKRQEFDDQRDRIMNLLEYEKKHDTHACGIEKQQQLIQEAERKLREICKDRDAEINDIVNEELKIKKLRAEYETMEREKGKINIDIDKFRRQLSVISRSIICAQEELSSIVGQINKLHVQSDSILKNVKIGGVELPTLSANTPEIVESSQIESSNSSASIEKVIISQVDFSQLVSHLGENPSVDELRDLINEVSKGIYSIQNDMKSLKEPNFKASSRVDFVIEQLKITNEQFSHIRKNAEMTRTQFSKVKMERYDTFVKCLDFINTEIDSTYKALVNDLSAQATLIPINSEEPYLDGLKFVCIAPGKRFQEMNYLSGGEKALASLALTFTIQSYKSCPLVILDEVDAALDQSNTRLLLRHIRSKSNNIKFLLISLKEEVLSHVDAIIGITQELDGKSMESKVFTLPLHEYSPRLS